MGPGVGVLRWKTHSSCAQGDSPVRGEGVACHRQSSDTGCQTVIRILNTSGGWNSNKGHFYFVLRGQRSPARNAGA